MTEAVTGLGIQVIISISPTERIRVPQITSVPDLGSAPATIETSNKDNRRYRTYVEGLQDPGTLDFEFIVPPLNFGGTDIISQLMGLDRGAQYGITIASAQGRWKRTLSGSVSYRRNSNSNDDVETATLSVVVSGEMSEDMFYEAYGVTYHPNGGVGAVPYDPAYYEPAENVTAMGGDDLYYGSKPFLTWNTSKDGKGTAYAPGTALNLSENMTLYAVYGP